MNAQLCSTEGEFVGLPWIQVDKEFIKSPKAIALGHALGVGRHAAVGLAVAFWSWASDHYETGIIPGPLATLIIDEAVGWQGPKSFAEAMLLPDVHLLEKAPEGLRIVGWERYAEAMRRAAEAAERARQWRGTRTRTERVPNAYGTRTEPHKKEKETENQIQKPPPSEVVTPPAEKYQPRVVEPPSTPPEQWTGEDFRRWCQSRRSAAGYVPERPPHPRDVSSWWSAATMTPGVTVAALKQGFLAFGADPYWEAKGFPFKAFMTQWDKYTRQEAGRGSTSG